MEAQKQLTPNEKAQLYKYEETIRRGLQTFLEVGNALWAIRDNRLYREHGTFDDYCLARWDLKRSHVYRLIGASKTMNNLLMSPTGDIFPTNERQIRPLTSLDPETQREVWQRAVETSPNGEITATHVEHVAGLYYYTNGSPEWYTPPHIIEAVEEVLGTIDLDPCSNSMENPNVPATRHYTQEDNGLLHPWRGRIFLNPPFNTEIKMWIEKLYEEWNAGHITEAIVLVYAKTETLWFNRLFMFPRCFIRGRLRFSKPNDDPAVSGFSRFPSVAIYMGDNLPRFAYVFSKLGQIYVLHTAFQGLSKKVSKTTPLFSPKQATFQP